MEERMRLFMMELHTLHITSTNPIPLKYIFPFSIRIISVQVIASGRRPYWSATCVILTRVSHIFVMSYFSLAASLSHAFRCSNRIPDGQTAHLVQINLISNAISSPTGVPYNISSVRSGIRIGSPSGSLCL